MFGRKKEPLGGIHGAIDSRHEDSDVPAAKPTPGSPAGAVNRPMPGRSPRPEIPRKAVDIPGPPKAAERTQTSATESKKLIVGREIHLKGEITSCDRLVVEGEVEVSLTDARQIEIAESGVFTGAASVNEADISGRFVGELTALDTLTIRATGRISGKIRYCRIIIEAGGQISGETEALESEGTRRQDQPRLQLRETGDDVGAPVATAEPQQVAAAEKQTATERR